MISELLSKINQYNERVNKVRGSLLENYEEYEDSEWDEDKENDVWELRENMLEKLYEFPKDGFFDEKRQIITGFSYNQQRPLGIQQYSVAPENPWYFEIDGAVFSRETGLLVLCSEVKSGTYVVPDDPRITGIADRAFAADACLKTIIMNDRIHYIGNDAFRNCLSLQEISIPKEVEYLGDNVFSGCVSLKKAELNCSFHSIPRHCFYNNTALKEVRYAESIQAISWGAFYGCTQLRSVHPYSEELSENDVIISSSIQEIKGNAFQGCNSVQSVRLSRNTKVLGQGAFSGCISLQTINTDFVEEYRGFCFQDCISLTSFSFSSHTKKLGTQIFKGANHLKTIVFTCAREFTCATDALPENIEYIIDTAAYLATARPYTSKALFLACVQSIAEGKSHDTSAYTARNIMKRNRKKHYEWFLKNSKVLNWILDAEIIDCSDGVAMLQIAEAGKKDEMVNTIWAYLSNHFSEVAINSARASLAKAEGTQTNEQKPATIETHMPILVDLPLEKMGLSVRAYTCLKRANLNTLSDVASLSDDELDSIRNLGHRCKEEVRQVLKNLIQQR